jgi:hypothetical protein
MKICKGRSLYIFIYSQSAGFNSSELARLFHELLSRDHEDGRATGQPQGLGPESCLNGTSQESTPEDARTDGHIRGRSKRLMKDPG